MSQVIEVGQKSIKNDGIWVKNELNIRLKIFKENTIQNKSA